MRRRSRAVATVRKTFPVGLLGDAEQLFIGYQATVAGDCDDGSDLLNSLTLTFHAGLLDAIDSGQVTRC